MTVRFEIRQRVATVHKRWLEVVAVGEFERPMRITYDQLVSEHPDAYFEFVRVETTEECLAYTPKHE